MAECETQGTGNNNNSSNRSGGKLSPNLESSIDSSDYNQISIRSLSELYLSPNQRCQFSAPNPMLSSVLLNNLRNRLNEYKEQQRRASASSASGIVAGATNQSPEYSRHSQDSGFPQVPACASGNVPASGLARSATSTSSISDMIHSAPPSPTKQTSKSTPLEALFSTPVIEPQQTQQAFESSDSNRHRYSIPKASLYSDSEASLGTAAGPKESRSKRFQRWLYESLNHPSNPLAIFYHLMLTLLFLSYILLVIFTDRTTWRQYCRPYLVYISPGEKRELIPTMKNIFERSLLVYFVLCEYSLRLYASRSQPHYEGIAWWRSIARYHRRPAHLFDLAIVAAGVVASSCQIRLPLDFTQDVHALIVLRGLHRLFNVAQWSSVRARHSPWSLMAEVFQEQGSLLFGIFYLETLLVFVMAYFVFLAETHSAEPNDAVTIKNMMDALYWSAITLLTIGYGDRSPVTYLGKVITSFGIVLGLGLFALPSGIIATSLAIKLNEQDQIRTRSERRTLAAILIQRYWRFQRRKRRFALAALIVESRRLPEWEHAESELERRASSVLNLDELRLRIDVQLYENLQCLVDRRGEFLQTQFVDLVKIQLARKRFAQQLKRNHSGLQPNSNRHLIKRHWIEHRQLTEMLEAMHQRLERYVQMEAIDTGAGLDAIESKLDQINCRFRQQQIALKKLNLAF